MTEPMVVLKRIKDTVCPECGARCYKSMQSSQHTNGQWNEYREFQCGYKIHYSPNFQKLNVERRCPNSVDFKAIQLKRDKATKKLLRSIDRLDVDTTFKSFMKSSCTTNIHLRMP